VSDIRLPDISGEDIFTELRQSQVPIPPFLFMTGHSALDQAVRLLKLGAADYLPKPLDVDALVARIRELGGRTSLLNPFWYAGAFAAGAAAGALGDRWSLAFLAETERQVEAHLSGHLERLSAADRRSRAVVDAMRVDEAKHRNTAHSLGAAELPQPVKRVMRALARVMTTVAYRV